MEQDSQVSEQYPVKKPPMWLYGLIIAMSVGILGLVIAIGYGLIIGFEGKKNEKGEVLRAIPKGKKFPDFNIKLNSDQHIEQVEYRDYRIVVYVKSSTNKENLIIILSATGGNEVGRFVIGE